MPRFLDTSGNAVIAIFICDRCKMKRPIIEAQPDPNFSGLKVCQQGCADQKDPYRLPARKTERITLQYPRPDVKVDADDSGLVLGPVNDVVAGNGSQWYISTQSDSTIPQQNGNEQIISPTPDQS